ncbi:ku p70 dna helicase [Stylonychia lemnae]|uniref:Ku p70 dna helicase n=1 Tax=Stylonychia lemnae TaxID=5949 RepID=A0A078AP83_STYLE|nr:ku p70 dna helicase [Stylonychia lemnae]|eukprot:CDW84185.1 ku p70 dna helicase [Stylonychia lemnae]
MDFEDLFEDNQEGGEEGGAPSNDMFMFGMNEKEVEEMKQNRDSVVFLVDCHRSMHERNPHNGEGQESNVQQILSACLSFMKTKIITSDNDKIGIVLYGCKLSNNSMNFNNIYVFQKLDGPDALSIKTLENKMVDFTKTYGFVPKESHTPLFEALWICHQEFKQVEKQSYNKRIFLFTNEDNPDTQGDREMAQQRASDLSSLGVDIELFPMPKPTHQKPVFDVKKFFANIIQFDEEEQFSETLGIQGTQSRISELMKRIRMKEFRKRTQGKCLFNLTPKAQIALSFFTTVMPTKKPGASKVNAANNKQLKSTTRYICQETGTVLYKNQISSHFPVGGEKVHITPEDVKQIKYFDNVGMKLMGFKPRSALKVFHNIKHSYFIYPDEKRISGSSQVMDALITEMIDEDKIAIVRFIPRDNSVVRFCALIPQAERVDEDDGFQTPPGFQLIFLPYADDIRDINSIFEAAGYNEEDPEDKSIFDQLTNEEKQAAKLMVKNMYIDFNSRNFENPSLQQFYAGLQALALNEQNPEPVEDLLQPDYEGMKRFDPVIDRFKDVFFDGEDEDPQCSQGAARGRGRGGARGARGGGRGAGASTRGGRGSNVNSQASQAQSQPVKGRGRGGAKIQQVKEESDSDEKELPSQAAVKVNQSKKRKEPPQKIAKKSNKRKKLDESEEEADDDASDLDDFIVDDSEEESKSKKPSNRRSAVKKENNQSQSQRADNSKSPSKKQQPKKSQKSAQKLDPLDQKFMEIIREGKLKSCNNAELKEFLTVKNLPNKGNKNFMMELVEEYFENNFNIS